MGVGVQSVETVTYYQPVQPLYQAQIAVQQGAAMNYTMFIQANNSVLLTQSLSDRSFTYVCDTLSNSFALVLGSQYSLGNFVHLLFDTPQIFFRWAFLAGQSIQISERVRRISRGQFLGVGTVVQQMLPDGRSYLTFMFVANNGRVLYVDEAKSVEHLQQQMRACVRPGQFNVLQFNNQKVDTGMLVKYLESQLSGDLSKDGYAAFLEDYNQQLSQATVVSFKKAPKLSLYQFLDQNRQTFLQFVTKLQLNQPVNIEGFHLFPKELKFLQALLNLFCNSALDRKVFLIDLVSVSPADFSAGTIRLQVIEAKDDMSGYAQARNYLDDYKRFLERLNGGEVLTEVFPPDDINVALPADEVLPATQRQEIAPPTQAQEPVQQMLQKLQLENPIQIQKPAFPDTPLNIVAPLPAEVQIPTFQSAPSLPLAPFLPEVTQTTSSVLPVAPAVPVLQQPQQIPDVKQLQQIPQIPQIPQMPQLSQVPQVPQPQPNLQQLPLPLPQPQLQAETQPEPQKQSVRRASQPQQPTQPQPPPSQPQQQPKGGPGCIITDANNNLLWGSSGGSKHLQTGQITQRSHGQLKIVDIPQELVDEFVGLIVDDYAFTDQTRLVFNLLDERFEFIRPHLFPGGTFSQQAGNYLAQAVNRLLSPGDVLELRNNQLTIFKILQRGK